MSLNLFYHQVKRGCILFRSATIGPRPFREVPESLGPRKIERRDGRNGTPKVECRTRLPSSTLVVQVVLVFFTYRHKYEIEIPVKVSTFIEKNFFKITSSVSMYWYETKSTLILYIRRPRVYVGTRVDNDNNNNNNSNNKIVSFFPLVDNFLFGSYDIHLCIFFWVIQLKRCYEYVHPETFWVRWSGVLNRFRPEFKFDSGWGNMKRSNISWYTEPVFVIINEGFGSSR